MKALVGLVVLVGVLWPGTEAIAFIHDAWVIAEDFKCADERPDQQGSVPECHIEDRKFGRFSTRGWVSGHRSSMFGMGAQLEAMSRTLWPALVVPTMLAVVLITRRRWRRLSVVALAVALVCAFYVTQFAALGAEFRALSPPQMTEQFCWASQLLVAEFYFAFIATLVATRSLVVLTRSRSEG